MISTQLTQLAVLDGDSPTSWSPFGEAFHRFKERVEREINFASPGVHSQVKWEMLAQPPDSLFQRRTWSSVVGALVDVYSDEIERRHERLCQILSQERKKDRALIRIAHYRLIVLVNGPLLPEHQDRVQRLDQQAVAHLSREHVEPWVTADSLDFLEQFLSFSGRQIIARLACV
jgi:hypothetical protein